MSRKAREKSDTGIYHVMLRGINRQDIFADDEDKAKYLQTLSGYKKICNFEIYAYCIMNNHVHILIKTGNEELERIFRRIGARYVYWYNWKYERIGHLFQDRFKSEVVEDDCYFLTVLRYILQNPLIAGLCERLEDYRWSSYNDYVNGTDITDTEFALKIISANKDKQKEEFKTFVNEKTGDKCLEIEEKKKRISDSELSDLILNTYRIKAITIQNQPREKQTDILREILETDGVTTRQLARVTGVSANTIWKI